MIFGMTRKKKPKNMQKKESFEVGMTWWFGRISDQHTS
jgi:hypothetical protein